MSWETIYTVDSTDRFGEAFVINETSITGHTVISFREGSTNPFEGGNAVPVAELLADMMNEVYNQVKKDIESGEIKPKDGEEVGTYV